MALINNPDQCPIGRTYVYSPNFDAGHYQFHDTEHVFTSPSINIDAGALGPKNTYTFSSNRYDDLISKAVINWTDDPADATSEEFLALELRYGIGYRIGATVISKAYFLIWVFRDTVADTVKVNTYFVRERRDDSDNFINQSSRDVAVDYKTYNNIGSSITTNDLLLELAVTNNITSFSPVYNTHEVYLKFTDFTEGVGTSNLYNVEFPKPSVFSGEDYKPIIFLQSFGIAGSTGEFKVKEFYGISDVNFVNACAQTSNLQVSLDTIPSEEVVNPINGITSAECGATVGFDPFDYPNLYNGVGVVEQVNGSGLELVINMSEYFNTLYPLYLGSGLVCIEVLPDDGVITLTPHYQDNQMINVNSEEFKDTGVTAEFNATSPSILKVDTTRYVKRYGYVNLYKRGIYTLRYECNYLGSFQSVERSVFVVEPNWFKNITPTALTDQSALINQITNRFNDIYWELNQQADFSRLNFDSRLEPERKYVQNHIVEYSQYVPDTDVDYDLNFITARGYNWQEGDIVRFIGIELPSPLENFFTSSNGTTYVIGDVLPNPMWINTKSYFVNDVVSYLGQSWVCTLNNVGVEPLYDDNIETWCLGARVKIAERTAKGALSILNLSPTFDPMNPFIPIIILEKIHKRVEDQGYIFELSRVIREEFQIFTTFPRQHDLVFHHNRVWSSLTGSTDEPRVNDTINWRLGTFEPGRAKDVWRKYTTYIEGDLIEVTSENEAGPEEPDIIEQYQALPEPTPIPEIGVRNSTNLNKYPLDFNKFSIPAPSFVYWLIDPHWECQNNWQRVGTFDNQALVKIAGSKGIPDWLLYQLAKTTKSRVALIQVFDFIINSRGTEIGFQSLLRMVGLFSDPVREKPEETETFFVTQSEFDNVRLNPETFPNRGLWKPTVNYVFNDIVYHIDTIYQNIVDTVGNDPTNATFWKPLWKYESKEGDNSCYEISVTGFQTGPDDTDCIEDEELQKLTSELLANLLQFSIPAYIKYDATIHFCNNYNHSLVSNVISSSVVELSHSVPPFFIKFERSVKASEDYTIADRFAGVVEFNSIENTLVTIDPDTAVSIEAIPESGYQFDTWEELDYWGTNSPGYGVSTIGNLTLASTTISVRFGPVKVKAVFSKI